MVKTRAKKRSVILRLALILVVLCLGFSLWFSLSYPSLSRDMVSELRYAYWDEMLNQGEFLLYWYEFFQKMDENAQGDYDFSRAAERYLQEESPNNLERAKLEFHQGNFEAAIRYLEQDVEDQGASRERLFWLAMSYLRNAEVQNCLSLLKGSGGHHHHHQGVCSLPLGQIHEKRESGERAAELFLTILKEDPSDKLSQWLFNFTLMTLGEFPEKVPEQYRLPDRFVSFFFGDKRAALEQKYSYLHFEDRARELGVDTFDAGKGLAVEDFNRDGYLDFATGGNFDSLHLYVNVQGQSFVDATAAAGLEQITQVYTMTAADYDNDGWIDLLVARPFHHTLLFRNRGDGTFEDVTYSSNLVSGPLRPDEAMYTCTSEWGDVDNDGDLDLFLGQFGQHLPVWKGFLAKKAMSSKLLLNEGGRFVDATQAWGLEDALKGRIVLGAVFADYDGDNFQDLLISSFSRSQTTLFRNLGGKRFEATDLIERNQAGFSAAAVDIDHDGDLDFYQSTNGSARTITENAIFEKRPERYNHTIYLNQAGRFESRSDLFRDQMPFSIMGSSYGDLDNDGCVDFYLGTGNPEAWSVFPNLMYIGELEGNRCTGHMQNISMLQGFGNIQKGHGIVFFDFDNDGDQDVYSSLGGMWPGDRWPNQLFVNESELDRSWTKIRLRGTVSNYYGIGSMIRVFAEDPDGAEFIRTYHMDDKTGFGSAPFLAHIGLLNARSIKRIEVTWPASGTVLSYTGKLGQLNVLNEAEGTPGQ